MGIKGLAKLLSDEAPDSVKLVPLKSLHGRKVAIDASMAIYQFLIAVRQTSATNPAAVLTNAAGETTSHIQGFFNRTIRFLTEGMRPAYVFDGKPPNIKSHELVKRREKREKATRELEKAKEEGNIEEQDKQSKRLVRAGQKENEDCKKLLRLMGVPVIEAPCEAEAQAAALCLAGKVWAVGTEDMDALTFRTPILLRKMTFAKADDIHQMDYKKALMGLGLTQPQFVDLCILLGCDYCDSIRGIGPKTALKLIREHGCIETILENLDRNRYGVPDDWVPNEKKKSAKQVQVEGKGNAKKLHAKDDGDSDEDGKNSDSDEEHSQSGEEKDDNDDNESHGQKQSKGEDKTEISKKHAKEEQECKNNNNDEEEQEEAVPIYVKARQLFNEHEVLTDVDLKWTECQPEELTKFLVDEMGFSAERVEANIVKLQKAFKATSKPQMRMDSFFKPLPGAKKNHKKGGDSKAKSVAGTKRKGSKVGGTKPASKKSSFARRR